jgi:hypothetical protein
MHPEVGRATKFFQFGDHACFWTKAALARTRSKTWRNFGGSLVREASWSARAVAPLSPLAPAVLTCTLDTNH